MVDTLLNDSMVAVLPLTAPVLLLRAAWMCRADTTNIRRAANSLQRASISGLVVAVLTTALFAASGGQAMSRPSVPSVAPLGGLLSLRVDGLSMVMFTMVTLLVLVVGRFSVTYLEGDRRHAAFLGRLAATAASVEILTLANHFVVFWLAWVAASVCLHQLIVFNPDRPRAVIAARKKFVMARTGDVLLASGLLALFLHTGAARLDSLFAQDHHASNSAALTFATVLIALAALLKSAQFPTHGWLIEVVDTPTPVSALLHAGILNGGPFLILRLSPIFEGAQWGSVLLLLGGGFTAAFASVVLRTQPSVKVSLAYSSAAHMGFSLFVCGMGVYSAAALHMVAHSFYKAHAFLSAGSAVDTAQSARVAAPARKFSVARMATGWLVACGVFLGIAWIPGVKLWDNPALLVVGAIVVVGLTQLLGTGFDRAAPVSVYLQMFGFAVTVTAAFFVFEEAARRVLEGVVPEVGTPPWPLLAVAVAVVLAWTVITGIQITGFGGNTVLARHLRVHLRHGLYANALFSRLLLRSAGGASHTIHEQVAQ